MPTESLTKPIGAHRVPQNLNTWPVRHELSALGLRWHQEAKCWHTNDAEALRQALVIVTGHLSGAEAPESPADKSPGGAGDGQATEAGDEQAPEGVQAQDRPEYEGGNAPARDVDTLTDRELIQVLREAKKQLGTDIGDTARESKVAKAARVVKALPNEAGRQAFIASALQGQPAQNGAAKPQTVSKPAPETNGTPSEGASTQPDSEAGDAEQKAKAEAARAAAKEQASQVFGPAGVEAIQAIADSGVNEDEVRRIAREVAREEDAEVVVPAIEAATKELLARIGEIPPQQAQAPVAQTVTVKVTIADAPEVDATAMHRLAPKIAALIRAGLNVALIGPPGVGKSHAAKDVGELTGFGYGGAISLSGGITESSITGRLLPIGEGRYLTTPFVEAYQNGGVYLLDEMDAADANVLLVINAALANGGFHIETRLVSGLDPYVARSASFGALAGMNTWGTGATAQFAGRQALDGATLDRWYPVFMDYDPMIVGMLFGAPPVGQTKPWAPSKEEFTGAERAAWQGWFYAVKAKLDANASKRVWSPRIAQRVTGARSVGVARKEVVADLFAGWKPDELARLETLAKGPVFA